MLRTLRDLVEALRPAPAGVPPADEEHVLKLATAVLLVEVMRADAQFADAERRAIVDGLRGAFELADDEIARLVELAEVESQHATDTFGFTSTINARFGPSEKVRMIEAMWRVAYADGELAAHENHLMRRVGDLLHVQHGDYIAAKLRARASSAP